MVFHHELQCVFGWEIAKVLIGSFAVLEELIPEVFRKPEMVNQKFLLLP
jgi:hypothetical protein